MDSTRGGPLSTLILMLPLVIVPAIALLRPAERDSGFVGGDVGATEEDGFSLGPSDFDAVFGDEDQDSDEQPDGFRESIGEEDAFSRSLGDSSPFFDKDDTPGNEPPRPARRRRAGADRSRSSDSGGPGTQGAESRRLPDLTHLGVAHSLWFAPGAEQQFGFVAFVSTDEPSVRYRFSAIQNTEARAVADVTEQIQVWRREQRGSKIRRAQ